MEPPPVPALYPNGQSFSTTASRKKASAVFDTVAEYSRSMPSPAGRCHSPVALDGRRSCCHLDGQEQDDDEALGAVGLRWGESWRIHDPMGIENKILCSLTNMETCCSIAIVLPMETDHLDRWLVEMFSHVNDPTTGAGSSPHFLSPGAKKKIGPFRLVGMRIFFI
jgi:hypothetical protein